MQYIKLQLGCLLVVLYVTVGYVRGTMKIKGKGIVKCDYIFYALLAIAPWAIIFDGITAWTVNHMDLIPIGVNKGLHLAFFLFMDAVIIVSYLYFYNVTIGLPRKKRALLIQLIPAIVLTAVVVLCIGHLHFRQGKTTNYSMGVSVAACYLSLLIHYGYILFFVLFHHRTIERRKKGSVITFIVLSGACLLLQIRMPEILLTAIYPVMMVVGIYTNFANPAMIRLQNNNAEMVSAFATVVETRDGSTGGHIKRTREYVSIILHEMAKRREYRRYVTKDYRENVKNAAPLHDLGKIATPDEILLKPGKLSAEEFEIMKEHAAKGGEIIQKSFAHMDNVEFAKIAYEVARYHHEKWNGKGYPEGLVGTDIPLHARVMAIADVFDALSEKRCYRDAMPLEKCFQIIEEGAGSDFDPTLVEIFLRARDRIEEKHRLIDQTISG